MDFVRSTSIEMWSGKKRRTKVFNWSEVHFYRSNFLQNPYFSNYRLLNGQTYFSLLYETVHSHLPYWLTIEHASQNEKNFRKFHQSERTGELSWKTLAHFTKDICFVVTPKWPKVNNWHQIFRLSYWT